MSRVLLPLGIAATLTACSTMVEHARFEIGQEASTAAQLLVSDGAAANLEDFRQLAESCGAQTRLFGGRDSSRAFLQVNFFAKTRDELDAGLLCAKTIDPRAPAIELEINENIIGKTYLLRFRQEIPGGFFEGGPPKELTFTMPADIDRFTDNSTVPVLQTLDTRVVGGNRLVMQIVDVEMSEEQAEAMAKQLCPPDGSCPDDVLERAFRTEFNLEVLATRSKIDLQAAAAIAGVLLGSGLVVELMRRVMNRPGRVARGGK